MCGRTDRWTEIEGSLRDPRGPKKDTNLQVIANNPAVADVACSVHRPGVFLYDNRLRQKKEFENSDKFSGMYICVKLVKSLAGRSRNIVCSVFVAEEIWTFDCSQTQINLVSDNFTAICDQVIT